MPSELEDTVQALGLEAQEEELYESYLAARVAQAKETLTISRAHLARDPQDPAKAKAVFDATTSSSRRRAPWQPSNTSSRKSEGPPMPPGKCLAI